MEDSEAAGVEAVEVVLEAEVEDSEGIVKEETVREGGCSNDGILLNSLPVGGISEATG